MENIFIYNKKDEKKIIIWLSTILAMLIFIIIIGGLTRLTGSGLSMVEWQPVTGIIPPITEQNWAQEFAKYKLSPEFLKINYTMSLNEFKSIYFLEYFHRLIARTIGFVLIIPLLLFALRRSFSRKFALRLLAIFILGALQGFIGWFMVKSGLSNDPHVSHIRLMLHLIMAMLISALILWNILSIIYPKPAINLDKTLFNWSMINAILILFQSSYGALVAGLKAGLVYNNFPLMGETIIAPDIFFYKPLISNVINNPSTVQLIHRMIALILIISIISFWRYLRKKNVSKMLNNTIYFFLTMLIFQICVGILTLIYGVPILLASLHQLTAVVIFLISIAIIYINKYKVH